MTDKKQMLPTDIIVLANGMRYRLGQKQANGYAEYEKSLGEWRESADVSNPKLKELFALHMDFLAGSAPLAKVAENTIFEQSVDQNVVDLTQATKVVYPAEDPRNEPGKVDLGHKYHRTIYGFCGTPVQVDVYRVIDAFQVDSPGLQHAIKKILMPGTRGAKDRLKDLREAANSINQAIKLEEQKAHGSTQKQNQS